MGFKVDRRAPRFLFATAASLLIMSGCAGVQARSATQASSQAGGQQANAGKRDDVICTMERSVGSNIPERICRYAEDIEEERTRTQNEAMIRGGVQQAR